MIFSSSNIFPSSTNEKFESQNMHLVAKLPRPQKFEYQQEKIKLVPPIVDDTQDTEVNNIVRCVNAKESMLPNILGTGATGCMGKLCMGRQTGATGAIPPNCGEHASKRP